MKTINITPANECHFLDDNDYARIKSMVKESAIMMLATILNVEYKNAESLYNLIFK